MDRSGAPKDQGGGWSGLERSVTPGGRDGP
jgi:hypothetical protein